LQGFVLGEAKKYVPLEKLSFPEVGLGLKVWHGAFEGWEDDWLRWCDEAGTLIATPQEGQCAEQARAQVERERAESVRERAELEHGRAEQLRQRAEQEKQRAEHEAQRAEQEKLRAQEESERAARLRAQLRALGAEPDA
jgi:hypothetical protein